MKKKIVNLVFVLLLSASFICGCSKGDEITLEDFYADENVNNPMEEKLNKTRANYDGYYSDVQVEIKKNTMQYKYTCVNTVSINEEALENSLSVSAATLIENLKKNTGVTADITIMYTYYNPDGSVVAEVSFTE